MKESYHNVAAQFKKKIVIVDFVITNGSFTISSCFLSLLLRQALQAMVLSTAPAHVSLGWQAGISQSPLVASN